MAKIEAERKAGVILDHDSRLFKRSMNTQESNIQNFAEILKND